MRWEEEVGANQRCKGVWKPMYRISLVVLDIGSRFLRFCLGIILPVSQILEVQTDVNTNNKISKSSNSMVIGLDTLAVVVSDNGHASLESYICFDNFLSSLPNG
jgi:hypothetical protein